MLSISKSTFYILYTAFISFYLKQGQGALVIELAMWVLCNMENNSSLIITTILDLPLTQN